MTSAPILRDTFGAHTFELRPYQHATVDALLRYFETEPGNPIAALPTGAGKSVIMAAFIRRILEQWPSERFMLLAHVKELLTQNADKLAALLPGISVGMYSAGLGRKELGYHVTVAGIQSIYKRAHKCGDVSIVLVDECHLVSKTGDTMYVSFLRELQKYCPHVRFVGLSATPYRLDSGPLIKGDARIFTDIAYSISIKQLIDQGYLAPLVSAPVSTRANTTGVKKRGGEFIAGDLERAVNRSDITNPALDEVERLCSDRRSWLVFCVGVDHANAVNAALRARGYASEVVVADTANRDEHLKAFKLGKLRALVSVGVLTTGFDAPNADALICLRPTCSPGLWVQIVGRVTRPAPGKVDGLVLDFTTNTRTHGPVDLIEVDGDGNVHTSPLTDCPNCGAEMMKGKPCAACGFIDCKPCPSCNAPIPMGQRECPTCGAVRESSTREAKHDTRASTASLLSDGNQSMREVVASWSFKKHTKTGKPDSVCVTYEIDKLATYQEWLCFEHGGLPSQKAAMWWIRHGGASPTPTTTAAALSRATELKMPNEIRVKRDGKYWRVA